MRFFRFLWVMAVVALVASGCGGSNEEEPSLADLEHWDLVFFSDSTGFGVAELVAEDIRGRLGVTVTVHDHATTGRRVLDVLKMVRDEGAPPLAAIVADAEMIVVNGTPEGSGSFEELRTCVSASMLERDPPPAYGPDDGESFAAVLRSIYEEILLLRDGVPTVIRAMDTYNPNIDPQRQAGIEVECTAGWGQIADTIRETSAEFGIPTVSMYDLFNGMDHDQDPRALGYIGPDGRNASEAGTRAMADAIIDAGYEPLS